MPSPTNPGEEGITDAPENDDNASMPEEVKRPNPWRKKMMTIRLIFSEITPEWQQFVSTATRQMEKKFRLLGV